MGIFNNPFKGKKYTKGGGYYVGNVLHVVGYMCVFGLTATCTFLMFQQYAPKDVLWVPFLALALVEYGTFKWWHYARHNAENIFQLLIAIGLGSASIIGIAACTGLEMSQWFHIYFADDWKQVALLYVIVLAVIEVIGFVGVGIVSNKNLTHWSNLGLGNFTEEESTPVTLGQEDHLTRITQELEAVKLQLREAKTPTDPLAQRVSKRTVPTQIVEGNGHAKTT